MGLNVRVKTLIFGGANEGRDLAEFLVTGGHEIIISLIGRVRRPAYIAGEAWAGGFGGANGLTVRLMGNGIDWVVDAIHPLAEQTGTSVVAACRSTGTPLLRASRPSWASYLLTDTWTWVASHDNASRGAAGYKKVLLMVGKQSLDHHWNLPDVAAHMVELPEEPPPGSWRPLLERGPFTVDLEKELLCDLGVDVLVTKDSGGSPTEARLIAAADLGVRMITMRRAPAPKDAPQVATPWEVLVWVNEVPV